MGIWGEEVLAVWVVTMLKQTLLQTLIFRLLLLPGCLSRYACTSTANAYGAA